MGVGHDLYRMLRAGMPPEWSPGERLVALIIADACNDRTYEGYIPLEQLCAETGYTPSALSDVLRRLGRRGYEMRIPRRTGTDGRPVYATKGHATGYRVPILKPRPAPALTAVDNSADRPGLDGGFENKGPGETAKGPAVTGQRPRRDRPLTPTTPTTPNNHHLAVIPPAGGTPPAPVDNSNLISQLPPIYVAARLAVDARNGKDHP